MVAKSLTYLPCALCGESVPRRPSEMKSSTRGNVFCCVEHYRTFNAGTKRSRKRNMVQCDSCGLEFARTPSQMRERNFCSRACSASGRGGDFASSEVGSTSETVHGYILEKTERGWVPQHRLVMQRRLGRDLRKGENVHHKNGDRADNRIENLELWITSQPSGQRVEDKVAYAREILALYGDLVDQT